MPIDINLLRVDAGMPFSSLWLIGGEPEKVKKSERDRFRDDTIVDQIIEIDNEWRKSKLSLSRSQNANIFCDTSILTAKNMKC